MKLPFVSRARYEKLRDLEEWTDDRRLLWMDDCLRAWDGLRKEREAHAETRKELERVKLHLRELFRHADKVGRLATGGILDRLRELDKAPGGLYPRAAQEDE